MKRSFEQFNADGADGVGAPPTGFSPSTFTSPGFSPAGTSGAPQAKSARFSPGGSTWMAMKMLLSAREASSILGPGGSICREIGQLTNTKLHISGRNEFYPGTNLQELSIKGPSSDSVVTSFLHVFVKLSEESGRILGDLDLETVPEGTANVKFVVPSLVAKAIIGRGGENVRALREATGMRVHIEEHSFGTPPANEQVVALQGSIDGLQVALPHLLERMEEAAQQPWFNAWSSTSQAGSGGAPVKGYGKGKGKSSSFAPATTAAAAPSYSNGKSGQTKGSWAKSAGKGYAPQQPPPQQQPVPTQARPTSVYTPSYEPEPAAVNGAGDSMLLQASLDMLSGAVASLPGTLANPLDRSQKITFNIPATLVSAVIGKGGSGTKEIAGATDTKIQIRDIEGTDAEKVVIVMGNSVSVVAAYLHLVGRAAAAQEQAPAAAIYGGQQHLSFQASDPASMAAAAADAEAAAMLQQLAGVDQYEQYDPAALAAAEAALL